MNAPANIDAGTELSPATLAALLRYNPTTGELFWRYRDRSMFGNEGTFCAWNARWAGRCAFSQNGEGYLTGKILGRKVKAHRIAWAMHYGSWPQGEVDHIDGDRSNNAAQNLRVVSPRQNSRNRGVTGRNTSGVLGVIWRQKCNKWEASITLNRKPKHLGMFANFDDAVAARKSAEAAHDFHQNHGSRSAHG
jgi:hypothetical protein